MGGVTGQFDLTVYSPGWSSDVRNIFEDRILATGSIGSSFQPLKEPDPTGSIGFRTGSTGSFALSGCQDPVDPVGSGNAYITGLVCPKVAATTLGCWSLGGVCP